MRREPPIPPPRSAFTSSAEILFGTLLIYQFRILERHWGTSKFAAFFAVSSAAGTVVDVALLVALRSMGIVRVAPGPYAFIAAAVLVYGAQVPDTYHFKVLGVKFGDKTFVYALAFQLAIAAFPGSTVAWIGGILAGLAYMHNLGGVKAWRFPAVLQSLASAMLRPLLDVDPAPDSRLSAATPEGRRQALRQRTAQRQAQVASMMADITPAVGAAAAAAAAATGPGVAPRNADGSPAAAMPAEAVVPDSDSLEIMVGMGFDRQLATDALVRRRNDVSLAVADLLEAR
nr:hypothetical protein HK105_002043 [Polyrhizophydium stewartii]